MALALRLIEPPGRLSVRWVVPDARLEVDRPPKVKPAVAVIAPPAVSGSSDNTPASNILEYINQLDQGISNG